MKVKAFMMNGTPAIVDSDELLKSFVRTISKMSNEISKQSRAINKKHEKLKIAEAERDRYKAQCEFMDEKLEKILNNSEWSADVDHEAIIHSLRNEREIQLRTSKIRRMIEKLNEQKIIVNINLKD